jgi:hypothetical protein
VFYTKRTWGMRMQKDLTLEEVFVGLGLSQLHHEDMTVLVTSGKEMDDFMTNYWIEQDKQFDSINSYRDDKINRNQMDFETFKDVYDKNKVAALEGLFWHNVHKSHVRMLEKRFKSGTLDLRQLYDWQQENKKYRLLRLVLSTTY